MGKTKDLLCPIKILQYFIYSVKFFGCPHPTWVPDVSHCSLPATPDASASSDGGRHFSVDDDDGVVYLCDADAVGLAGGYVRKRCFAKDEQGWRGEPSITFMIFRSIDVDL